MPVLDEKYDKLYLNDQYLRDKLLLALAWKKAHEYIRTANWYADNFELDISSIDLPNRCDEWAGEIERKIHFSDLELVPAPKSHSWEFIPPEDPLRISEFKLIWQPKKEPDETANESDKTQEDSENSFLRLRPLAHIGIREQTIMTLVMMCLANEVETKQGDPSTDYKEVHEKGVVSYGNRLYCRYEDDKAEHNYGATTTYSKYFTDYRKFLERPYHFARKELQEKSEEQEVYLLEIDLSQFFDCVDREQLVEKIKAIAREQGSLGELDEATITNVLKAFKNWGWSPSAKKVFPEVCSIQAPAGLPQGLVASGFFANIYMAEFDDFMKNLIGQPIGDDTDIRLADYCRYVDDMRLVLVGPSRNTLLEEANTDAGQGADHLEIIKSKLLKKIIPELKGLNLDVQPKKTKIEAFRGKSIGISSTLEDIQTNVSGPVAYEDAEIHLGQLESLLVLSDTGSMDQSKGSGYFNRLATIEKDMFDVREDTLKRFAANKISRLLNNIRHFTSREVDENGHPIPGNWDYLQERLARRFIACWSRDPALVLLLKKGLELFPSTRLLEPVLEQLDYLISLPYANWHGIPSDLAIRQAAIGKYCLAEIFRHAATVIHRKDRQAIPAHANIDSFFESLQSIAVKTINESINATKGDSFSAPTPPEVEDVSRPDVFNFLANQARFLLLVRLDTVLETSSGCWLHDFIFKLAKGFRSITLPEDAAARDLAAGILIARQLIDDPKPLHRAAASLLENRQDSSMVLELIAIQDAALLRALVLHARALRYSWQTAAKVDALVKKLYIDSRPSAKPLPEIKSFTPIYKLIARADNPFGNEIMALKLMLALLKDTAQFATANSDDVIDLSQTKVKFDGLCTPPAFKAFRSDVSVELLHFHPSLGGAASHLHSTHDETFILQRVALCLRAVLQGSGDPTGFGQNLLPRAGYRGLKTTQFKRQIGLLTTPESLAGEAAPFSGWLTTLLSKLLKWPGIRVNDHGYPWPTKLTLENVSKLVEGRLAKLEDCYCQQSQMPGLPELVSPTWSPAKNSLIVAMVQTKMPLQDDFVEHGLFLDTPECREKHRRHVARVAKLVTKHIEAQHLQKPNNGEREQDIDLIVLPELAVHQDDDLDILIQLSRKTHAIIVAGLGFLNQPGVKGPNNCAIWIVPRKHNGNRSEIHRLQGKYHMTSPEKKLNIQPWRPYQLMLELSHPAFKEAPGFMLTAAICFDSTDIALSADLRDKSHALLIPALNKDVNTFDSMVEALHYHMYQHVVLVNTGEYGGSYAMAPYSKPHERLIAHSSGNDQVTINTFKMNMFDFRRDGIGSGMQSGIKQKAAPAGINFG